MQTLGAIVQAYASILALGGAFLLFVIEGNKRKLEYLEDKIDNWIITADKGGYLEIFRSDIIHFRRQVYEMGSIIIEHSIKEQIKNLPIEAQDTEVENFYPHNELYKLVKRYESAKKRTAMWSFRLFNKLITISTVVLISTLAVMGSISHWGLTPLFYLVTVIIQILSGLGFSLLILTMINLVRLDETQESK